jgi:hypothetical protein
VALIGSRYSTELGGPYAGGVLDRVRHLPPAALSTYFYQALPRSIVPSDVSPLPASGPLSLLFAILRWTVAPLVIIGFVVWVRRHRDVTSVAVPAYLLETLLFPFTNERRVMLVLPVILAWYVLGAVAVLRPVVAASRSATRPAVRRAEMAVPVAAAVVVLAALLPQLTRDYLFAVGQSSSSPGGSPYMHFIKAVGRPDEIVESSYLWSTALYSGHRSAGSAYNVPCDPTAILAALHGDGAAFVLSAALNQPGLPDGWCLVPLLAGQPGMVLLYSSPQDLASVFELVGPGSAQPNLSDLAVGDPVAAGDAPVVEVPDPAQIPGYAVGPTASTPSVAGRATLTWTWAQPRPVTQVSLGFATGATTTSVTVELLGPDGVWHAVSTAPGPVGAGQPTRFLLASFPFPTSSSAVRVTVVANGTVKVGDLHVLGPRP